MRIVVGVRAELAPGRRDHTEVVGGRAAGRPGAHHHRVQHQPVEGKDVAALQAGPFQSILDDVSAGAGVCVPVFAAAAAIEWRCWQSAVHAEQ